MVQILRMVPIGSLRTGTSLYMYVRLALLSVLISCILAIHCYCINRVDGAPALGWEGTLPYLILPVFLVISQFVSMQLMQPKSQDPEQQQANVVLKFLPIMIGWFSLNVPSALCIYWVVNNIVTTGTTLLIRNSMPDPVTASSGGAAAATAPPPAQTVFSSPPSREKPSGFASAVVDDDEVKPITTATAIDAEVVSKETDSEVQESAGMETASSSPKKVRLSLECNVTVLS